MLISAPTIILFLRAIYRGNYYMMVYSKAWTHAFCLVEQGTWRETDLERRKDRFTLTTTMCVFSWVWLFVTPWAVARQAPLFMGFSRQEYRSGLPFPPPGIFLIQGSNLCLLRLLHCRYNLDHCATHGFTPALGKCLRGIQGRGRAHSGQVVKLSQDEKKGGTCRVEC